MIFQTAVAVVCKASGFVQEDLAPVRVQFRDLSDAEIEAVTALAETAAASKRNVKLMKVSPRGG